MDNTLQSGQWFYFHLEIHVLCLFKSIQGVQSMRILGIVVTVHLQLDPTTNGLRSTQSLLLRFAKLTGQSDFEHGL